MVNTVFLIALSCLAVLFLIHILARARFSLETTGLIQRVLFAPQTTAREAPALPDVVRDFAKRAGVSESNPPAGIILTQSAELRMTPDKPWRPITATQAISAQHCAFAWIARQRWGPITFIRIIDAYVGEKGKLKALLFGSIPLAKASGSELDRSEALRYLAELAWCPDALICNCELAWHDFDNTYADVSLGSDHNVRIRICFDANGDIAEVRAESRGSMENGTMIDRPWMGRFSEYRDIGGRRIPVRGEVGYVYDDGYAAYWRGTITSYRLIDVARSGFSKSGQRIHGT